MQGEFLFVASDPVRSVRLVQDRHLESIRAANFLWLVCPDGYVGQSASMEIGFAAGAGVPIFATRPPADLTLREYVSIVPTLPEAVRVVATLPHGRPKQGVLINPHASIEEAHASLERLNSALLRPSEFGESAQIARIELARIQTTLRLPTLVH